MVADEIRRLADRVTGPTKDIRALIGEVSGAVNATVISLDEAPGDGTAAA